MSVSSEKSRRGLNNVAKTFTATDGSEHSYIEFMGVWLFSGVGAVGEVGKAIAGDIPAGSEHRNLTDGTKSIYNGSAWETVTVS